MSYPSKSQTKAKKRFGSRRNAAKSIQAAWRDKKRRQQSLLQRTALANRRLIKKVAGDREVLEKNDAPSMSPDFDSGQGNIIQLKVNNHGLVIPATGAPVSNFCCNLIELSAGIDDDEFTAREIIMKSISVKLLVENDNVSPMATTHFYLIHDSQPNAAPLALLDDILLRPPITATGYIAPPHGLLMSFTNKNNVGKDKRIQILDHKWVAVSAEAYKTMLDRFPLSAQHLLVLLQIYMEMLHGLHIKHWLLTQLVEVPPHQLCVLYIPNHPTSLDLKLLVPQSLL